MDPISLALLGGLASALVATLRRYLEAPARLDEKEQTFETRVDELVSALRTASRTVTELEAAVRSRQDIVARLQEEQRLLELNAEELQAIKDLVRTEIQRENKRDSRRNFWISFGQNAFFFGLGIGASLLIV